VPVKVGEADITTLPVPVIALDTRDLSEPVKTAWRAVAEETIGAVVRVVAPDTDKVVAVTGPGVFAPSVPSNIPLEALIVLMALLIVVIY
jgi:hypothetical protein